MNKKNLLVLFKPLEILNNLIPKNDELILLYSNLGFRDNIRSLYNYLIKNEYNKKYHIVCSLNDYRKYQDNETNNVSFVSNLSGLRFFLRAKHMFFCFGKYPIMPSSTQVVVNLWHGMPLKTIGKLEKNNSNNKYDYFSYVLATSDYFKPIMADAFGCTEERVLVCGQPRTDELYYNRISKAIFNIPSNNFLFLWMPTFRYSEQLKEKNGYSFNNGLPICDTEESLLALDKLLQDNKAHCIIKIHPLQKHTLNAETYDLKNIIFMDDELIEKKELSLYELISCSDALITDYSSVYIDYLLLNRPICFITDDLQEYKESRGFIVDNPLEIMPGEKVNNFAELTRFIQDSIDGKDRFESNRKTILNLFHRYQDDQNTERLLRLCGIE